MTDNINSIYMKITHVLLEIGMKTSFKGFFYVREAVAILTETFGVGKNMEEIDIKEIIPKALYIDIGHRFSVSCENVEKSIRVAINDLWKTTVPGQTKQINGHPHKVPEKRYTNTQIIFLVYCHTFCNFSYTLIEE